MATKTINGVKHARGCACPHCDPDQRLAERVRQKAREQRRAWALAARVVPLPLPGRRPRVLLAPFETEKTRRFRELLREGVSSKAAAQIIESELLEVTP